MAATITRPDPLIIGVCDGLLARTEELSRTAALAIRDDEPRYVELMSTEELAAAVHPNLAGLIQSVRANEAILLAAPRRTGRERARARVPLTIVLHAYRVVARMVWDELVKECTDSPDASKALLDCSSTLWNAVDVYAHELAAAYRDVETEHLLRNARVREAALASLFSGASTSGQGFAEITDVLNLPTAGRFAVVVSDPWHAESSEEQVSAERALASAGVRSAWRSEANGEVGLVVMTRNFGPNELIAYLNSLKVGRVGVSQTFEDVLDTPQAVQEARLARDTATPSTDSVQRFGDARVAALVASTPELARGLTVDVLGPLLQETDTEQGLLIETLRAERLARL